MSWSQDESSRCGIEEEPVSCGRTVATGVPLLAVERRRITGHVEGIEGKLAPRGCIYVYPRRSERKERRSFCVRCAREVIVPLLGEAGGDRFHLWSRMVMTAKDKRETP